MGGKAPFSIRWEPEYRIAFEGLVKEVEVGRGVENASELAREILEEWALCEYGLGRAIELDLLGKNTTSLPYPHHLYEAIAKYERSAMRLAPVQEKVSAPEELTEEVSRHMKAADRIAGGSTARRKASRA